MASKTKNSTKNPFENLQNMQNMDGEGFLRMSIEKYTGEKLGKNVPLIDGFVNIAKTKVTESGADFVRDWTQRHYYRKTNDVEKSIAAGRKAESIWRWVGPLSIPAISGVNSSVKNLKRYKVINEEFSASIKAHHGKNISYITMFSSDLEIVRNMRKNVASKTLNGLKETLAEMIGSIFSILSVQVDSVIKAVDEAGFKKSLKKSRKNRGEKGKYVPDDAFYDAIQEKQEKIAAKANERVDKVLGYLKKDDGEYHKWIQEPLQFFTDIDVSDLEDHSKRSVLLLSIKNVLLGNVVLGAGGWLTGKVKQIFRVKGNDAAVKPNAGKLIIELKRQLAKNPALVRVSIPGSDGGDVRLEEYIEEIFRQNERDNGRGEISSLVEDNLKQASRLIAEAMNDPNRMLMPQAMALLADKKAGIFTYNNGKVDEVMHGDELVHHVHQLLDDKGLSNRVPEKPSAFFEDRPFSRDDLIDAWDGLSQEERMVFGMLFPLEILRDIGVSEEEIDEIQTGPQALWKEVITATFDTVKRMKSSDFKEMGFNKRQIAEGDELLKAVKAHLSGNSDILEKKRRNAEDWTARVLVGLSSEKRESVLEKAIERHKKAKELRREEAELTFSERLERSSKSEENRR